MFSCEFFEIINFYSGDCFCDVKIDDFVFFLVNSYNANTETVQLHTLNDLSNILKTFGDIQTKKVRLRF